MKCQVHIASYSLWADFNEVRHSEIMVGFESGDTPRGFFDLPKKTIRIMNFKVDLRTVIPFAQDESCNSSDISSVLSC